MRLKDYPNPIENNKISMEKVLPFYQHHLNKNIYDLCDFVPTSDGISYKIKRDGYYVEKASHLGKAGIFILGSKSLDDKMIYLMGGMSTGDVSYRCYRHLKELLEKSRPDETSPAAKKLREAIKTQGITLKKLTCYFSPLLYERYLKKEEIKDHLEIIRDYFIKQYNCIYNSINE